MIRLALGSGYVAFLVLYAWKDWYKALCGLVILMAVIEHPDMPKNIAGVQGLNPWNILFASVFLAWLVNRGHENLTWDLPGHVSFLLLAYLGIVVVGFVRMVADPGPLAADGTGALMSENLVNTVKWVIPGLMLYDGCRSRERFKLALFALLGIYILLGVQVIRWMPLSAAINGAELGERSLKILKNEVGYHRVNLSMMLAGASWAVFASARLAPTKPRQLLILLVGVGLVFAQALTAGRTGYITWAVVGLCLSLVRWRKSLVLTPVVAGLIIVAVPGVYERISQGFTAETRDAVDTRASTEARQYEAAASTANGPDAYTITAGRNIAWPFVIDKISESPVFGYGREAMVRVGLTEFLWRVFRESFPHPHNAYLECLLDNGWLGLMIVVPFYLLMLGRSLVLFRDSRSYSFIVAGGVCASLILALLVASVGSQTFYPREGAVGMWCAIGVMMRMWVARTRVNAQASPAQPSAGMPAMACQPAVVRPRPAAVTVGAFPRPRVAPEPEPVHETFDETLWSRAS